MKYCSFSTTCSSFLSSSLSVAFAKIVHSGRHSFASLITLEAGVPMETICKMLGHKDVKMTQRYARVTQKKLFEDMDKFIAATEKDFFLAL